MSQILVKGGNIWDGTKNPLQHNIDLLITDTKITTIGKNLEVKENIQVINAVGKTIIPGLIDMHVHVQLCGEDSLYGFLGTGITSIRDLGSNIEESLPLRESISSGSKIGPRMFVYGPLLDGDPSVLSGTLPIARISKNEDEGIEAINELINAGVDGIKLYAGLRPSLMETMIRTVDQRVPTTGHLGRTTASEAIQAGIDGLEHLHASIYQDIALPEDRHAPDGGNGTIPNYWTWLCEGWARANLDADYVTNFIELLVTKQTALSPTTVLITGGWATDEALSEPGQKYRPRSMSQRIEQQKSAREKAQKAGNPAAFTPVDLEVGLTARAKQLDFLKRLHEAGGIIVPSTDVGAAPNQVPGFSLHRELELLSEAGFNNSDILHAATQKAAQVLGYAEDIGTVEVGKEADILIIDGNPLDSIQDTRKISSVLKAGTPYDPQNILDQIII